MRIQIINSPPKYILLPELIEDPSFVKDLIQYHTDHEKPSLLDVTRDNVSEVRIDYRLSNKDKANWINGEQNRLAKKLHGTVAKPLMEVMNKVLRHNSPIYTIDKWDTFWIRKYTPSTRKDADSNVPILHYDFNSTYNLRENKENYSTPDMASVSIALNDPDEYEGGEILISNGFQKSRTGVDFEHCFTPLDRMNARDGVLWDGWTLHGINPVLHGERYVLVIHFQGTLLD